MVIVESLLEVRLLKVKKCNKKMSENFILKVSVQCSVNLIGKIAENLKTILEVSQKKTFNKNIFPTFSHELYTA